MAGLRRAAHSTAEWAIVVVVAPLVGFGVPLLWVWVASRIAGPSGRLTIPIALFIVVTILGSYWLILLAASWIRTRIVGEDAVRHAAQRSSWNRSFRDERLRPGAHKSDPIERLFMTTAVVGFVAFQVWYVFFAGSPLPAQ
ncbi:MAG TPA: hypothetical protein VHH72_06135 [Solirubrobacterales bacterium]|jgi:hypothetical protein|nr:hypothetical protein [Solirubrobacterales bacterium]